MSLSFALKLGLASSGGGTPAAFAVNLTGLTAGEARIGDFASIGYTITPDNGTETVAWGNAPGDSTYGTGASPTNYDAGDGGLLYATVTDDGETVSASAPIRKAPIVAATALDFTFTVDVAVSQSVAGAFTLGGNSATYTISPALPTGLSMNDEGLIIGTVTSAVADATYTITATDTYGRTVTNTATIEVAEAAGLLAAVQALPFVQVATGVDYAFQEVASATTPATVATDPVGFVVNQIAAKPNLTAGVVSNVCALSSIGGELLIRGDTGATTVLYLNGSYTATRDMEFVMSVYFGTEENATLAGFDALADRIGTGFPAGTLQTSGSSSGTIAVATAGVGILRLKITNTGGAAGVTVTGWWNGGASAGTITDTNFTAKTLFTLFTYATNGISTASSSFGIGRMVMAAGGNWTLAEANAAADWVADGLNTDPRSGAMT